MDDQNQTNQPLDQGTVPSVPLDITPQDAPVAPPVVVPEPEVLPPTPPVETPVEETPAPPAEVVPVVPWVAPEPTPVPEITAPPAELPVVETPAPVETPMPAPKQKSKVMPVIGGIVALLLVVGGAGAAYYVSNQLSTRQAVAPNAPTSKPAASGATCEALNIGVCGLNGGCIVGEKCKSALGYYYCQVDATCLAPVCTGGQTSNQGCAAYGCAAGTSRQCTCSNNAWSCQCITDSSCGGGGGGGGTSCVRGGTPACGVPSVGGQKNTCVAGSNYTFECGLECCNNSANAVCCCTGCFPAGTDCSLHTCGVALSCDEAKRDDPASNSITFANSGRVIPFVKNNTTDDVVGGAGYDGTITLSKAGVADKVITLNKGAAVELTPFDVTAGDVYSIKMRFTGDPKDAYGWIPNKSPDICGPVKTPGAAIDANSKPTGFCGEEVNISAVKTLAAKADLTGITAGGTDATIQCWGDAEQGDATQDYDYDDFTLVLGYEKSTACGTKTCNPDCPTACGTAASTITTCTDSCGITTKDCAATAACVEVGACMLIDVYKLVDGVYGTVPLKTAQLQALKVGDVVKLTWSANIGTVVGRYKVTVNGVAGSWTDGAKHTDDTKLFDSSPITIAVAGTYQFEAQVSTTP
jgi:hypothetical protein